MGSFIYPKQIIKSLTFIAENVGDEKSKKSNYLNMNSVVKQAKESNIVVVPKKFVAQDFNMENEN